MTTIIDSLSLRLPTAGGDLTRHQVGARSEVHDLKVGPPATRQVFAAAHVVVDPTASTGAAPSDVIDWDATLAFRRHLWALGLGVADAMDTAQRGGGLDWATARQLISRSGAEARAHGGGLVCGAMTDQLDMSSAHSLGEITDAYLEQASWIRENGGIPVLMASRHLATVARTAEDYLHVYNRVLDQLDGPVMLHWLGAAFDPAMATYWGSGDLDQATETFLDVLAHHASKITGVKVSLLDAGREVALRRRLPAGVEMFTGDDFNYAELIAGDDVSHSNALLGAFDLLAAPARAALGALDDGDLATYHSILDRTVPLSRHVFCAPTWAYKTGVVFLAWLNGHQTHFHMLGGTQSARSVSHLVDVFTLADSAAALSDPELAVRRMQTFLNMAGVEQ